MEKHNQTLQADEIKRMIGKEKPLILEIGCHNGSDTMKFLQEMPQCVVHCFECDDRALKQFRERFCGENPELRIQLWPYAVTNENGWQDFYASTGKAGRLEDWDLSGSLCKPTGHLTRSPEIKFKDPRKVNCIRLDIWFGRLSQGINIDFIWADVQGSQRRVIAGGQSTLAVTRWLYMEAHDPVAYEGEPTQEELVDLLSDMFEPIAVYARENILFKNRNFDALV